MDPQLNGVSPSVPDIILDSQRLRESLHENVARLRITLDQSKAIAAESTSTAVENSAAPAQETQILARLTKRELEVFCLIAEGKSTKQLAAELGIAFRTGVCHRYRIF